MADKSTPILVKYAFLGLTQGDAAAMSYIEDETNKIGGKLNDLLHEYSKADLPLLVSTLELCAAGLRAAIGPEGGELADQIKGLADVMIVKYPRRAGG